jgi:hypothetical protein
VVCWLCRVLYHRGLHGVGLEAARWVNGEWREQYLVIQKGLKVFGVVELFLGSGELQSKGVQVGLGNRDLSRRVLLW